MANKLQSQYSAAIAQETAKAKAAITKIPSISLTMSAGMFLGQYSIDADISSLTASAKTSFDAAVAEGHQTAQAIIRDALDKAMASASWGWIEGARDIISTGALRNSLTFSEGGKGFEFYYSSDYAALVHYGGYVRPYGNPNAPPVYLPGRPWVDAVMEGGGPVPAVDLSLVYESAILTAFR
jgi:hypothetical protein